MSFVARVFTFIALFPVVALAGPHDFVAHVTRLGGDTSSAQPFIDKFCRHIETKMGWPASSVNGKFFSTKAEALAHIESEKPGIAMVEPAVFFELRNKLKLEPVLQIESKDLSWTKLNVVVKDPAFKALADLKGKSLCAMGADSPVYLSKIVFDGKFDAAKHFQLKPNNQSLKGVRGVLKGECDATLLDDETLAAAAKMEGGADLKSIYTSPKLPATALSVVGKSLTPAEKKKLAEVLTNMCSDAEGKAICTDMRVEKFAPVDAAAFTGFGKKYDTK